MALLLVWRTGAARGQTVARRHESQSKHDPLSGPPAATRRTRGQSPESARPRGKMKIDRQPEHYFPERDNGVPMRLIHTSDWHLGRTLCGEDLLPHQAVFLDCLLAESVGNRVDAVVVAADIYDRAVPPTDAVAVLDRALRQFAAAHIPVLLVSGNHDSAIRLGFGASLSEQAGVHLRTDVADLPRPVVLADSHGSVALYAIAY